MVNSILVVLFWINIAGIFWAMIGYPIFIKFLGEIKGREVKKNYDYEPTVTVMVVAHNEEKIIQDKLKNIISLNYPKNKIKFLITSDNSTDNTDSIVEKFILNNLEYDIKIYKTVEHKGKTNAQNEAQKYVNTEILVMTDANAMLEKNSIRELISCFIDQNVAYVCGKLIYKNTDSVTAESENTYWNLDLMMREMESEIQTITAGNGAIYACRNDDYYDFDPIECHDSAMPLFYGLKGKRAIFNRDAVAYEKAGENDEDELKRKTRMNRNILNKIIPTKKIFNIFKYKWFSVFYLGHRTCRYMLWLFHIIAFAANLIIVFICDTWFYKFVLVCQVLFWILTLVNQKYKPKNKLIHMIGYYGMTIYAQFRGVLNVIMGKTSPIWEKAESTR